MAIFAPPLRRTLQELRDDPEERVWRKDIRSTGWDGGTDLSSVDTAATKGYFVDFSADAAQFETLFYQGEEVGVWKTWTPTYATLTLGNGTVVAEYVQIGKLVIARFSLTFGSTTTIDGSNPTISKPVNAHADYSTSDELGVARCLNSGSAEVGATVRNHAAGTFVVNAKNSSATYQTLEPLSATVPFTWATNDKITFTATYEAA